MTSVGPRIPLYILFYLGQVCTSKPTYIAFYIFILFGAGNEVSCYVITILYTCTCVHIRTVFCIFITYVLLNVHV